MKYEDRILKLFKNEYLTTKDVNDNDIPRFYLTKLIKENKIERVSCLTSLFHFANILCEILVNISIHKANILSLKKVTFQLFHTFNTSRNQDKKTCSSKSDTR